MREPSGVNGRMGRGASGIAGARSAGAGASWGWALALFLPAVLGAQELPAPDLALVVGHVSVDHEDQGDASAAFWGGRFRMPLGRHVAIENSIATTRYRADVVPEGADTDVRLVLVEFQLQVQYPARVSPYLGVGAGGVLDLRDERGGSDYVVSTYSLAAGAATDLGGAFGLRGEARLRGMDETRNSALEFAIALAFRF